MKRRRSSVKKHIHWLPDFSAWSSATFQAAVAKNTSGTTSTLTLLDPDTVLGNAQVVPTTTLTGRAPFMGTDIIVDAISGKFSFAVNGKPVGQTAASGVWTLYLRFGIIAVPRIPQPAVSGGMDTYTLSSGVAPWSLDPADGQVNFGSLHDQSLSWWWRRDFAFLAADFDNGVGLPDKAEYCTPPGPYIYIKPRKRLRPSQTLVFAAQMTTVDCNNAAGKCQLAFSPSLRIAAHRDMRRD